MPKNFNPEYIMNCGIDIGLNVKELHARGITEKGIRAAIIDKALGAHQEFKEQLIFYKQQLVRKGKNVYALC